MEEVSLKKVLKHKGLDPETLMFKGQERWMSMFKKEELEFALPMPFCFIQVSADWMRLTHVMNGNLPDSEPTDLNINQILQNTLTATSRMFDQILGFHGLVKLMHKIYHHI